MSTDSPLDAAKAENEPWLCQQLYEAIDADLWAILIAADNRRNFIAMGDDVGLEYCVRLMEARFKNAVLVLARLKARNKGGADG
jgi:hypothetical protein